MTALDATTASVYQTKLPTKEKIKQKLCNLGWRGTLRDEVIPRIARSANKTVTPEQLVELLQNAAELSRRKLEAEGSYPSPLDLLSACEQLVFGAQRGFLAVARELLLHPESP